MTMLSGLESLDEFSSQHNSNTDVRQVGKFQLSNKSTKKGAAKSVSFILPAASITGPSPMGSFSKITNPSYEQAKIDIPMDNPLHSSIITSDCNEVLNFLFFSLHFCLIREFKLLVNFI
ncbi:hypothetical protein BHM03_00049090 [Ensete ventricosum]|nr:hypothetical protein BHM03_00049090 [Ensete ventricosum]